MHTNVFASTRFRSLVVNSFTSFNLVIGLLSLIAATTGAIWLSAWGLLCCVLLDMCDGSLARRWDVSSDFGAQLDSLADMTSFIVAGATLLYYWVQPTTPLWLIVLASAIYTLSGAFRLARFNSTSTQPDYFQGMPTTFVAAAVAANYLVAPALNSYWVLAVVVILAILMVSLFPYPKVGPATIRRLPPVLLLALVVGAVVNISWTVWVVTVAYVVLGPSIWLRRRLQPATDVIDAI